MYQVDIPIDFQQTLSNIYGEETYQINYKARSDLPSYIEQAVIIVKF